MFKVLVGYSSLSSTASLHKDCNVQKPKTVSVRSSTEKKGSKRTELAWAGVTGVWKRPLASSSEVNVVEGWVNAKFVTWKVDTNDMDSKARHYRGQWAHWT